MATAPPSSEPTRMSDTESVSGRTGDGRRRRFLVWLLLDGSRLVIAFGIVGAVFLGQVALGAADVTSMESASTARSLFASGFTAGLLTLVTVSLSINQLLLSRVFGSPASLRERLDGTLAYREDVEQLAHRTGSPNDPIEFLGFLGTAMDDRIDELLAALETCDPDTREDLETSLDTVSSYVTYVTAVGEESDSTIDALVGILGSEFAESITAVRAARRRHTHDLPATVASELDALARMLESVAILRQFFKTVSIQQELAELSRQIAYGGTVAVFVVISLSLTYREGTGAMLPEGALLWTSSLGIAVGLWPLALLVAYLLRIATITRYTVSIGPFVPPEETFGGRTR